jgi:hypothetical protein
MKPHGCSYCCPKDFNMTNKQNIIDKWSSLLAKFPMDLCKLVGVFHNKQSPKNWCIWNFVGIDPTYMISYIKNSYGCGVM